MRRLGYSKLSPGQRPEAFEFTDFMINEIPAVDKIKLLSESLLELKDNFGDWKIEWGEINRYQRLTGNIQETYNDDKPSIPVGFTSSVWGSLAAFSARTFEGTKKRYGTGGNSFVAVVEFGPKLIARSVVTGGQSSDPKSGHFTDQAGLFCNGQFKAVNFYPEDVRNHAESTYHPGE